MIKKSGLGRGLSALIPVNSQNEAFSGQYQEIPVGLIDPNPDQPRQHFDEAQLQELSDSIKHNGVIQPIIVTKRGDRFLVIAGERRWRATKLAEFEKIPAIVREVEKGQMLSLALLENIQRQELNPIEEAMAYHRLIETHRFTHETLAGNLGKNRATISNTLRLLKLPEKIQDMIQDSALSFGHARCLIPLNDDSTIEKFAHACIEKQWSVRELERRVQAERERSKSTDSGKLNDSPQTERQKKLGKLLGTRVSISGDGKKGRIMISYGSEKQYQMLVDLLEKTFKTGE